MIDNIIKFSISNKLIIGIMTLLLIIWGVWSATRLPIDAVPDITNNQVQIITVCPTLASQEVEQLVTFPIEQSISNLPDIEETRSISRFGLSVITVVFDEDVDIYFARQIVSEKLNEAIEDIPKGIGKPELAPVSTGLGEVYQYILHPKKGSNNKYTSMDLRTMQDWIVARQLNGTPGVAEVNSFGGELKQYEVAIDPNRLKAMNVSIIDIFNALENNNQNTGGAYIDKKPNAYFIRGIGLVNSIEDIKNIAVKNETGSVPIFIKDVAEVRYGYATRYGALTYNGTLEAVGGVVMMLKGANSNEVVKNIKNKMKVIQQSLPSDVVIEPYLDRTNLVDRAIHTVEKNLIEGALIVIFVLVLFLGNIRAGLIVASAIPLSMLFALGMMRVFGVSANLMSLGAIDFGLIVDGAVIVVEATLHHLGLRKSVAKLSQREMDEEVFLSATKIRKSAAFGEIIILIVYIPILTLVGIEGKMFTPMAKTVGFAILGALILSLTYIPMMSAMFLSKKIATKKSFSDKAMTYLQTLYLPLLKKSFKHKYKLIGIALIAFTASIILFKRLGGEFIPQLQEGDFAFHCILPQGSSLSQSIETSMQASRIIKKFDEVKMVVGKTGTAEVPTDPMPPEASDMIIVLKPQNEWKRNITYEALANEIYDSLQNIPGIFFEVNQPIQMRFNELMTGIRQDVAVKIFGENLDSLSYYAQQVSNVLQSVKGVSTPQIEAATGLPQINVVYDRTRLANYGINVSEINDILSTAFAGKKAGEVYENERRFDLVVRLDSMHRSSIEDVNNLMIPTHTGIQIPLSQVATVSYQLGPAQISRESGKRRIVIGFNVQDRDVKSVVQETQQKLNKQIKLPVGYYFTYGGQFENLQKANSRLLIAVPISLLLIFVLLYFTFSSLKQAAIIFMAIPMSAIGGVLALFIRGMPFSISAGVGFIALFGVAVLNGIVLIGTFNQLAKEGIQDEYERVILGTKERLRPVLMTATVASLGFLPMAISTSAGAEVQRPLATVVIGGLISATLLTLFVLPLLYIIFNKKNQLQNIHSMKSILALIMVFAFSFNSSIAQSKKGINIQEALNIALQNNGNIKADSLAIRATNAYKKSAFEIPKTNINMQLGQYSSIHFDNSFQISQTIPFPTVFGAKAKLNNLEIDHKKTQKLQTINSIKTQTRFYFYQIQHLQQCKIVYAIIDSLYNEFIHIANTRYNAGDVKKIEINNAKAQQGEINLQLQQNEMALTSAYQNLRTILNTNEELIVSDSNALLPLQYNVLVDSASLANHPIILSLLQKSIIESQKIKVERTSNLPDITVGYSNQSLIGFQDIRGQEQYFDASRRFSYFNIGLSIPLFNSGTQSKVRALEYEKQATNVLLEQQKKELHTQLVNYIQAYNYYTNQYQYYINTALKNADDIVNAALVGYKAGDVGYVEYLYALQTGANIQLNYLGSIWQINQTVINIYSLLNL